MAVELDGVSDYWKGTSLGTTSKRGTIVVVFRTDSVALSTQALFNITNTSGAVKLALSISTTKLVLIGRNAASSIILNVDTEGLTLAASTWYLAHAAFDLEAGLAHIYVNDTDYTEASPTIVDDSLDLDQPAWVGAVEGGGGAAGFYDGRLEYVFFSTAYKNPSVEANRRKFIGERLELVGLGANGAYPLGVVPELLLNAGPGNFGTNRGSGPSLAGFGTPTDAPGRPATVETLARGFRGELWRNSERSGLPFPESQLVLESASGHVVARREWSTDRDEINRGRRLNTVDGE